MHDDTSGTGNLPQFADLGLPDTLLKALAAVGYETPSPIQARTIPPLLAGRDVLGQAQTGTGKTAAFALPLLARIDLARAEPQLLVLAPTRELAIQVAEAFQRYAAFLPGFHVAPVYGGQDMRGQLNQLKRGVHVVVGTPGRVMDHMRRGSLNLDALKALVLDEADEMLRMGFIDDVTWILEQTPPERQIALFSATLPAVIQRIAEKHLNDPEQISIKLKTTTAETIRQRYWYVSGMHKLDALTRILEVEEFDGVIVFVRTKTATLELAEKMQARGYEAVALNGDVPQKLREQTVQNFKNGKLDILIATDVAARGLDVDRVSHVINYDIPYDTEAYVHRIGRTGRAGRSGEAILFVAPREKRLLSLIERATRQKITEMQLPTTEVINDKRIANFHQKITDTISAGELDFFRELIASYEQQHDVPPLEIAAALAKLAQQGKPLLLKPKAELPPEERERKTKRDRREERDEKFRDEAYGSRRKRERDDTPPPEGVERFRIEVGHAHGVKPGNIMGAIANEAGLEGRYIGRIQIFDDHSLVDLPESMPPEIFQGLKKTRVAGQALRISRTDGKPEPAEESAEPELPPFGGKARALKSASRETAHSADKKPRAARPATRAPHGDAKTKPAGKPRFTDKKRDEKPRAAKPAGKKARPGKNARMAAKAGGKISEKPGGKSGEPAPRARRPGTLTTRKKKD
ncbi:MAG TPA: DEAD/DEAH box helicase [Gammaproteobacteria bacterium]